MRLTRLDLTRYGKFTDRSLHFPPPGPGGADFHIVYGPNEAGKSTAFAAWLDLLFGIGLKTPYAYLHPGPTMRIGARLDLDGRALDLIRVKKASGSLLDASGAPLPEAVVQAALGGMGRDAYQAMFSLDDDTLERGGDSILASKGDLGEMLFAASAGLADLSQRLDALRLATDEFHRPGGRKGAVTDAKARLDAIDQRRKDLDTQATAFARLAQDAASAEADWHKAQADLAAVTGRLRQVQRHLDAAPLRDRLARLVAELGPLSDLTAPPDGVEQRLAALSTRHTTLTTRLAERAVRLDRLDRDLAALTPDPAVLAQSAAIAGAEALRGAHDEAVKDLPARQQDMAEAAAEVAQVLAQLDRAGADPGGLVLQAPRLAGLRALLARRSGLVAAHQAALAEVSVAEAQVRRLQDRLAQAGAGADTAAVEALIARLTPQDPADVARRALRDRDAAQAGLADRLRAVSPWQGSVADLAALAVPMPSRLDGWAGASEVARATRADAARALDSARAHLARLTADSAARDAGGGAGGITLDDALAARAARERLWAAHRAALTPGSADAFEAALRRDDQIAALMGDARAEARAQAADRLALDTARDAVQRAEAALAQADADAQIPRDDLARSCADLGLPVLTLADLRAWLDARAQALTAETARQQAQTALDRAERSVADAAASLRALMATPDQDLAGLTLDALWAQAQARIAADRTQSELRRGLQAARDDLARRSQTLDRAAQAMQGWQDDWSARAALSVLEGQDADVAALGRTLDLLDALGQAVQRRDGLQDRIAKMQANRDRFGAASARVRAALGLPAAARWADITQRLRDAETAAKAHHTLLADRAEAARAQDDDQTDLSATAQALDAIAADLGCDLADLPVTLAACRRAQALRCDIADLTATLAAPDLSDLEPDPDRDPDPQSQADLQFRADRLTAEAALLRQTSEDRFARWSDARRQLEAVGGDDAVARLEAERQTVLLDLEDRARAHLARRLGIVLVEQGLRRYRDGHRSGMLARASDAFRLLSRGAYHGLSAQPDGTREVLVAQSAGGGAKLAADLSKGTRFQLYLALRIAGYHELAQSRTPVPFIADDIMETFDDDRSAEAFSLLSDMSRTGQVIYLTHHRHLCDIARSVCPHVQVLDLTAPV